MTKKTFLKKLEVKLEDLDEKQKNSILKKYERIIDEEIASGKNEKDVVASLGDIDLIVKLNIDNVSDDSVKDTDKSNDKKSNMKWIDYTLKFIDDAFKGIDDQLAKRILLIICFIFVAFIFASIIHIPFKIVEYIGLGIFNIIFSHYFIYETVRAIWIIGLNICYTILIIWFAIHYIEAIINKFSTVEGKSKSEPKKKEEITIKNNDFFDVIFIILKVFVVILTIPFFFAEVGLIIAFIFLVSLIIQGVMIFGPAILLLGLILLFGSLLDIIYTSLSRRGDK